MLEELKRTVELALDEFDSIQDDKTKIRDVLYIRDVIKYCLHCALQGIGSSGEQLYVQFPEYPAATRLSVPEINKPVPLSNTLLNRLYIMLYNGENARELKDIEYMANSLFQINKSLFDLPKIIDYAHTLEYYEELKKINHLLNECSIHTTELQSDYFVEAMRMVRLLNPESDPLEVRPLNSGELDLVAKYKFQEYKPEIHLAIFDHAKLHNLVISSKTLEYIAQSTDNEEVLIRVIQHSLFDKNVAEKVAHMLVHDPDRKNWTKFQKILTDLIHSNKEFLPELGQHVEAFKKPEGFSPAFAANLTSKELNCFSDAQIKAANRSSRNK